MTASSLSGIQSAVNTTVSQATRAGAAAVEVGELDLLDPRAAVDRADAGARPERRAEANRRAGPERGQRLVPWQLGRHTDRLRAPVGEREQRREAHVLGADHERAAADPLALQVDELLERARRHHAGRPRARHEPRRAGPLAAAAREDHGVGLEQLAPARAGELERPGGRPARDHRLGAELGARAVGELALAGARRPGRTAAGAGRAARSPGGRRGAGCRPARARARSRRRRARRAGRARAPPRGPPARRPRRRRSRRAPRGATPARPRRRSPGSGPCARGCAGAGRRGRPAGSASRRRRGSRRA